jgi:uncharacterized protein YlaN (UPF0358 family)
LPRVSRVLDIIERMGEVGMVQLNQETGLPLHDLSRILEEQKRLGIIDMRGDGHQLLFSLSRKGKARVVWREMPEQGWMVVGANHRRVVLLLPKGDESFLVVAGYHLGAMRWNEEGDNFLIKLELIDESERERILPKLRKVLPHQFNGLTVAFAPPTKAGPARAKTS